MLPRPDSLDDLPPPYRGRLGGKRLGPGDAVLGTVRATIKPMHHEMTHRKLLERLPAFKASHCMPRDALSPVHRWRLRNRRYGVSSPFFLCFERCQAGMGLPDRILYLFRLKLAQLNLRHDEFFCHL